MKIFIKLIFPVCILLLQSCMELIPSGGEQISKINTFNIQPNGVVIPNGGSFTVTMDVALGYDMDIYMQDQSSLQSLQVYHADKESGYDRSFTVTLNSSLVSNILSSDSKRWGTSGQKNVSVQLGTNYLVYAKVCDFQIVAGNGNCATSGVYQLTFINSPFM